MYKMIFSMILMVLFATPVKAKEPTWEEIQRLELVFQTLNAIDTIQTIDCLDRDACYEINPMIGKNPSTEKIIGIKAASGVFHYFIVREIYKHDPKIARAVQYITIGIQGSVVAANMRFAF